MKELLLFDVNETLLDLRALSPAFASEFGDDSALPLWFAQLLRLALVATLTGNYSDFAALGADALDMVAARQGRSLDEQGKGQLLAGMRQLPPHEEVPASLDRLRAAGVGGVAFVTVMGEAASDITGSQLVRVAAGRMDVARQLLAMIRLHLTE